MNCQDISRIVDTGSIRNLTEAERSAAESHALSCRDCAAIWGVQSRLAMVRVPATPPEVAARLRVLAAMPAGPARRNFARRLTLVGGLVALAAAAGVMMVYVGSTRTPDATNLVAVTAAPANPAPVPVKPEAPPVPVAAATSAPAPAVPRATPPGPLPLLPAPPLNLETRKAMMDLALQKAVERHPELVEGPEVEDMFAVAIVLREDGRVINSMARFPAPADFRAANAEVEQILPKDGGNSTFASRTKGTRLPDGRALRANISFMFGVVPNSFDVDRSSVRVLQIVRDRYKDLLLPATGGEWNSLTIFLSEDGQIQRESVRRVRPGSSPLGSNRPPPGTDPGDVLLLAADVVAKLLQLDVGQIGQMGLATLEEGSMALIMDADGEFRRDDQRQILQVFYAWPRAEGEAGPAFGQIPAAKREPAVNLAVALAIVEREIPDAFRVKDPEAGEPTVALTRKGELLKAGRVHMKGAIKPMDWLMNEQLVPGQRRSYQYQNVRLKNDRGETADITFAWETTGMAAPQPAN